MKYMIISFMLFFCTTFIGNLSAQSVKEINTEGFKQQIWNYKEKTDWTFVGDRAAIIDLYAPWCGPCKRLAPILEDIQKELGNKIQIYKINTDNEREIAQIFNVSSIPLMVFIPKEGKPFLVSGLRPKEQLMKIITENLGVK